MSTAQRPERVLAVDYGTKRIGLAITDPTGVMALPLPLIEVPSRSCDRADVGDPGRERERAVVVDAIRKVVREKEIARIIVGHPLNTDDTAGPRAKDAESFAKELESALGVPVEMFDERFTTQQAESMLAGVPLSRKRKRAHVNSVAAQVLLESYLSARSKCL
ncbi:MAG: Holliday junction resolvase RuvX [Planctomycetota bacterium]|nr:Holliday junction resolvase RuvX [Planctomycetota bacterium]